MFRRIALFLALNFLIVLTISFVLSFFNIRPYLNAYGLDYSSLLIFCFVWGMGGALISLFLSKSIAKWMMRVKVLDPNTLLNPEEKKLFETVRMLSLKAGLKAIPEVGIYNSREPNAFATGPSQTKSLVAVSTGLLNQMNQQEVEGVIGHEISHIANGDMVTMTLLQGVVNAFVMFLARVLAYVVSGLGKNNRQGSSTMSYFLFVYLFEIVFMILGSILVAAYSRFREYRADRGGAELAGKSSMIASLQALKRMQEIRDEKQNPAMAAFQISRPRKKSLLSWFATHPPLESRIERLEALRR